MNLKNRLYNKQKRLKNYYDRKFILWKKRLFYFYNCRLKGSILKYPIYNRKVFIIVIGGKLIKKHYSKPSIHQTITLECNISKNKIIYTAPANIKGFQII